MKTKWGIRLRSKYNGEEITLGSQYDSQEKALEGAKEQVCLRCNTFNIISLPSNPIWVDKKKVFFHLNI